MSVCILLRVSSLLHWGFVTGSLLPVLLIGFTLGVRGNTPRLIAGLL